MRVRVSDNEGEYCYDVLELTSTSEGGSCVDVLYSRLPVRSNRSLAIMVTVGSERLYIKVLRS